MSAANPKQCTPIIASVFFEILFFKSLMHMLKKFNSISTNTGFKQRKFTANITDGQTTEGIITSSLLQSLINDFKIAMIADVPELDLVM